MTASRSATMNGATSANSTAVCPCSEVMLRLRIVSARARIAASERASEGVGDETELAGDAESERAERADDREGDQRQHNAVLRHRLAVLARGGGAENAVPVA